MLLIPEFPSSVLAFKIPCPSLFPLSAVPGFSIPEGRKGVLHFPPTAHRPGAEGWRAKQNRAQDEPLFID